MRRLIRRGRVQVGGEVCRDAALQIAGQPVLLDGEPVVPAPTVVHLALNKPRGHACSHDPAEGPIVDELLPEPYRRLGLEPAGRLDRATHGLLVLSSDGQLVHRLTHPARKVEKRYRIAYHGDLVADAVSRCSVGIEIEGSDQPTRPARLELGPGVWVAHLLTDPDGEPLRYATLHLREGRFHQVRRMIAALGGRVVDLMRDRIGDYELPADLEVGGLRELDDKDLRLLLTAMSL